MKLNILTILGLSTILFACGGNKESDDSEVNDVDSLELATEFNAASNNPAAFSVFDTIEVSGNLVEDLSFTHGIAFAQRLMRERITFIDATDLGNVFLEFENGTKLVIDPKEASLKLRALSETTQNFQKIDPIQKREATEAFASLVYEAELKYAGLKTIDTKKFVEGLNGFVKNKQVPSVELIKLYSETIKEYEDKIGIKRQAESKAEGMNKAPKQYKFLADKSTEEGIFKTKSGLLYEVITPGTGTKPNASNKVKVHYEGSTIDGNIFDSSYKRGEPIEFGLGQVIKGWTEGLQLMSPGAKYKLYIPQDLGYGPKGTGDKIPPFATLIFTVELISFQ
jgi:FKBP-type peptidyl-prolyl cis-trans isomerase FklB